MTKSKVKAVHKKLTQFEVTEYEEPTMGWEPPPFERPCVYVSGAAYQNLLGAECIASPNVFMNRADAESDLSDIRGRNGKVWSLRLYLNAR